MTEFIKFKDDYPKVPGFYIFRYKEFSQEDRELKVYTGGPHHHYSSVYSYPVTMHNYRDKNTCHDMGMYVWVNSYTIYGPVEWRKMTVQEALEFSETLFHFGRPSWAHKSGRKHLTIADFNQEAIYAPQN